jgi:hypothetical protein
MKKSLKKILLFSLFSSLGVVNAAPTPVFNFKALTVTTLLMGQADLANVRYLVTNKLNTSKTLVMRNINGVTQETSGTGYCSNPFTLAANGSCILSLLLDSSQMNSSVNNAPEVCQTKNSGDNSPDPFLCERPEYVNSLTVRVLPTTIRRSIPISVNPSIIVLQEGGSSVNVVVTNHTTSQYYAKNVALTIPSGWSDVTQDSSACTTLAPNESCTLVLTPGATPHTAEVTTVSGDNTQSRAVTITVQGSGTVALSQSVEDLALSVRNTSLNSELTGKPRKITITNTGDAVATNVVWAVSPALPSGTSITPITCGAIAVGGTCELIVTPDSTASSSASTLTISGSNTTTLTSEINVLTYGSIYQQGYVFDIDDATVDTGSVGGKAVALTNQASAGAPDNPNGIIWSSDENGDYDEGVAIYGISEDSTTTNPKPSEGQVAGQSACDGESDGSCNTTNIIAYYSYPTLIPTSNYAAGLCTATISGFSNWYLPAENELRNIDTRLSAQGLGNMDEGYYWSSTQLFDQPRTHAMWASYISGQEFIGGGNKRSLYGVRCTRALDY